MPVPALPRGCEQDAGALCSALQLLVQSKTLSTRVGGLSLRLCVAWSCDRLIRT